MSRRLFTSVAGPYRLPKLTIATIVRQDGSGTTYAFSVESVRPAPASIPFISSWRRAIAERVAGTGPLARNCFPGGESTGKGLDLDCFDSYYLHLFLWNKVRRELVGAYRIGSAHEILSLFGLRGLYTSTLFHYDPEFFRRIGPVLELGRSFIRPEYQRLYPPLLLLWKGLATYVARNPEAPVLFGAVSVSNEYNPASRRLWIPKTPSGLKMQAFAPFVRSTLSAISRV